MSNVEKESEKNETTHFKSTSESLKVSNSVISKLLEREKSEKISLLNKIEDEKENVKRLLIDIKREHRIVEDLQSTYKSEVDREDILKTNMLNELEKEEKEMNTLLESICGMDLDEDLQMKIKSISDYISRKKELRSAVSSKLQKESWCTVLNEKSQIEKKGIKKVFEEDLILLEIFEFVAHAQSHSRASYSLPESDIPVNALSVWSSLISLAQFSESLEYFLDIDAFRFKLPQYVFDDVIRRIICAGTEIESNKALIFLRHALCRFPPSYIWTNILNIKWKEDETVNFWKLLGDCLADEKTQNHHKINLLTFFVDLLRAYAVEDYSQAFSALEDMLELGYFFNDRKLRSIIKVFLDGFHLNESSLNVLLGSTLIPISFLLSTKSSYRLNFFVDLFVSAHAQMSTRALQNLLNDIPSVVLVYYASACRNQKSRFYTSEILQSLGSASKLPSSQKEQVFSAFVQVYIKYNQVDSCSAILSSTRDALYSFIKYDYQSIIRSD